MTQLLVITPVHDEAAHIERVALAVAAQTRPPDTWIVVDDASGDDTLRILRRLEGEIPFLTVLARPPRPAGSDRLGEALEVKAFNQGLAAARIAPDVIGKLDGDIELRPTFFADLLAAFAADPGLGVAGGRLIERHGEEWRTIPIPERHVHGAVKFFTAACFTAVGGLEERLGWDTIDETRARMLGYRTRSLAELVAVHHRPYGSAQGVLRGRARHGECAWILQHSVWWMLLKAGKLAAAPPRGSAGVAYAWGYLRAALRRTPRVTHPGYRQFVRGELRTAAVSGARTAAIRTRAVARERVSLPRPLVDDSGNRRMRDRDRRLNREVDGMNHGP
jgi:biofilm PGA synthesis N-glycosyltransferase PgaC